MEDSVKLTNCVENYIRAYESRLRNNNIDLHMLLYSCNHCFEYNPYTKEVRPFNSIFWYNIDKNKTKYHYIMEYLLEKHNNAKYFLEGNIGIILENTLAVDLDKLIQDIIPKDKDLNKSYKDKLVEEGTNLTEEIKELYSNWKDVMTFVLNNYKGLDKLTANIWSE